MRKIHALRVLGACAVLLLTACDLSMPSQVHTGHIRLVEKMQTVSLPARSVKAEQLADLAQKYAALGDTGGMDVTIGYLHKNTKDESQARAAGAQYQNALRKAGMTDPVRVSYVPVADAALTQNAVVAFRQTVAEPPAGCPDIVGGTGAENLQAGEKYKMGCATKTALSKMVSRPADLKGVAGDGASDSSRQGVLVEKNKTGVKNEKIQGINASTLGGSGG